MATSRPHELSRIALIGNYLPRRCGIATYTTDTRNALKQRYPDVAVDVYAMEDGMTPRAYPPEVVRTIAQNDPADYRDAASLINSSNADVIWLQHEYGIFGGPAGDMILRLLDRTTAPLIVTLHTILSSPDADQRRVLDAILRRASRIIVMADKGRALLEEVHGVAPSRVAVIPHGIPDRAFVDPETFKPRFDFQNRKILLTFGLLSPGKGIEHMIEAMPEIIARHPQALYVVLGATHPHLIAHEGEAYRNGLIARATELGVAENVRFINEFVETDRLLDYLAAADLYVTPYLNEAQITSGTLSYAMGLGKPVISTPYWHAVELLSDDHGRIVPFGDSGALAAQVIDLLDHPDACAALRGRAYARGRTMIWPRNAEMAWHELALAVDEAPARIVTVPMQRKPVDHVAPSLAAVERLTDGCGILQHSLFMIPNRDHGYCVDDNARALILMHRIGGVDAARADALAVTYASFVQYAWNGERGRFRNFMSYDRRWLEEEGSEDSIGRSLWSLGVTASEARDRDMRTWAASLYDQAASPALELSSLRAQGFAMLGACAMLDAHPGHDASVTLLRQFGQNMRALLLSARAEGWHWFESCLAYDNARLPEALIRAGLMLEDHGMVADGLATLEWLKDIQTAPEGHFRPVGTDSFGREMQRPLPFDQQPLEAVAMIDACDAAHAATGDSRWLHEAEIAYGWYLGANDLELPIASRIDGGCYDGLMPDRVNLNQGAESVLSFQLACCAIERLAAGCANRATGLLAAE